MPELPEVETVTRDLRPLLVGQRMESIRRSRKALRQTWRKAWERDIVGRRVTAIDRRGKWIVVTLESEAVLIVHLGMTGQLTVAAASDPRENHTHLVIGLDNGHELRFRDTRRFGSVTYLSDGATAQAFLAERLGPEPWDTVPAVFVDGLRATARSLKAALLDQRLIAGVGNIYADEACFEARLDPTRSGKSLSAAEAGRLLEAVKAVLDRAIASRGTTIRDYMGGSRLEGEFQHQLAVYGRGGEPCVSCAGPLTGTRAAGRTTTYCPVCQI